MTDELKSAWWKMMIGKYGSEEAVRQFMREAQQKSMQNPSKQKGNYRGPFNAMTPEELKQVSQKGVQARKNKP